LKICKTRAFPACASFLEQIGRLLRLERRLPQAFPSSASRALDDEGNVWGAYDGKTYTTKLWSGGVKGLEGKPLTSRASHARSVHRHRAARILPFR
jgi:hypothetical protein